jgi:hypothetical protein
MLNWLSLLLSEAPGEPSIRRVLCALATLVGLGLCFCPGLTSNGKDVAIFIIMSAYAAMTAGRFAEAMDQRGGEPPADRRDAGRGPGTPDGGEPPVDGGGR